MKMCFKQFYVHPDSAEINMINRKNKKIICQYRCQNIERWYVLFCVHAFLKYDIVIKPATLYLNIEIYDVCNMYPVILILSWYCQNKYVFYSKMFQGPFYMISEYVCMHILSISLLPGIFLWIPEQNMINMTQYTNVAKLSSNSNA